MTIYSRNLAQLVSAFLLFFLGCSATEEPGPVPASPAQVPSSYNPNPVPDAASVLFVGNSLTYSNDLPKLVSDQAEKNGSSITTASITAGNTSLEDHWNSGEVHQLLQTTHFDFVVVQQGPSSQAEGRGVLLEYGSKFKELCDQHESKLVFFMVWPAVANYSTFDFVIKNYTEAASQNDAILCPVGAVWKDYIDQSGDLSYYSADRFHPSEKGSTVAAEIIYKTLFLK